jgi:hypothetical protein
VADEDTVMGVEARLQDSVSNGLDGIQAKLEQFHEKASQINEQQISQNQAAAESHGMLGQAVESLGGSFGGLGGIVAGVATGVGLATVAMEAFKEVVGAMKDFINDANKAYDEECKVLVKLQALYGEDADKLMEFSDKRALATGQSAQSIRDAAIQTGRILKDASEEQTEAITKAGQDLGTLTGDTVSASEQIARAIETGSSRQLQQMGIEFDKTQSPAERYSSIMAQLTERFGGLSDKMGATGDPFKKLRVEFDQFTEKMGEYLAPTMKSLSDTFEAWLPVLENLIVVLGAAFVVALNTLCAALDAVMVPIDAISAGITKMAAVVEWSFLEIMKGGEKLHIVPHALVEETQKAYEDLDKQAKDYWKKTEDDAVHTAQAVGRAFGMQDVHTPTTDKKSTRKGLSTDPTKPEEDKTDPNETYFANVQEAMKKHEEMIKTAMQQVKASYASGKIDLNEYYADEIALIKQNETEQKKGLEMELARTTDYKKQSEIRTQIDALEEKTKQDLSKASEDYDKKVEEHVKKLQSLQEGLDKANAKGSFADIFFGTKSALDKKLADIQANYDKARALAGKNADEIKIINETQAQEEQALKAETAKAGLSTMTSNLKEIAEKRKPPANGVFRSFFA